VFGDICKTLSGTADGTKKWVPTVIFEVDGKPKKEVIELLYVISKQLSSDSNLARCIIVLSDANAALSMRIDGPRQRYVWIADFADDEANKYLDRLNFTKDTDIRTKVFNTIGTRPNILRDIALSNMSPDEFISEQIANGISIIKELKREFKCLLDEMIKCGYDDGLYRDVVMDRCNLTSYSIFESRVLKKYHVNDVISIDMTKNKYHFLHEQCTKQPRDFNKRRIHLGCYREIVSYIE
jgi:hypothetical protein